MRISCRDSWHRIVVISLLSICDTSVDVGMGEMAANFSAIRVNNATAALQRLYEKPTTAAASAGEFSFCYFNVMPPLRASFLASSSSPWVLAAIYCMIIGGADDLLILLDLFDSTATFPVVNISVTN